MLARQKTTRVLIATLVLVALALTLECLMLVVDKVGGDDTTARDRSGDGIGAVSVPADRPVLADDLDVKAGVDAAAKAAQEIVAVDFQKFDDEVDKAADLMTARFAESLPHDHRGHPERLHREQDRRAGHGGRAGRLDGQPHPAAGAGVPEPVRPAHPRRQAGDGGDAVPGAGHDGEHEPRLAGRRPGHRRREEGGLR
ncbi:hypothetical protein G5V59_05390 [Nocardioides sp. W3-2-3]|uniref:hypothetical protein n=1 Tax=Nocardioides convexus TaxID=2712224 RepID=UPI0024188AFB|nr:hypothetical protein [Nocardioides convexus]NGZ99877.1 hypothetical protein [Nocardioides convexus]